MKENEDLCVNVILRTYNLSMLWNQTLIFFLLVLVSIALQQWILFSLFTLLVLSTVYLHNKREVELAKLLKKNVVKRL